MTNAIVGDDLGSPYARYDLVFDTIWRDWIETLVRPEEIAMRRTQGHRLIKEIVDQENVVITGIDEIRDGDLPRILIRMDQGRVVQGPEGFIVTDAEGSSVDAHRHGPVILKWAIDQIQTIDEQMEKTS